MAIEQTEGGTIITGERDIRFAQLLAWKHALRLEILGMHRRGRSVYSIIKQELGFKGTKQRVLEQLLAHIETKAKEREAEGDA